MSLKHKIRSIILSRLVHHQDRTIGMEEECFIYTADGKRLPVNPCDEFSATDLLSIMNEHVGRNGVYSLEPGGQLEWSSPPFQNLNTLFSVFGKHKQALDEVIKANDLRIVRFGVDPYFDPKDIGLIDQLKYQLMDANMQAKGTMGQWMMRNTTSVQINYDVTSEQDLEEITFVADCLQPVSAYLFSNSPMQHGEPVGNKNLRNIIWENTDNDRCRNLIDHGITSRDGIIDQFIDYVMTVPGIFELDESGKIVPSMKTMEQRLTELELSNQLRVEDIQAALHQIFTNVRLKDLVEIRGADRPPSGYELAPVAFWTGLLLGPNVRQTILEVVSEWTLEERHRFNQASFVLDDSQIGPQGKPYRYWNQWAGELALDGLKERNMDEEHLFDSFFKIVMENGPFALSSMNQ